VTGRGVNGRRLRVVGPEPDGHGGRECAWCTRPAVCEIEVQPAEQRTITRVDPITGERTSHQRLVRSAITVPACNEHAQITTGQPPRVAIPRERRAHDVDQLGLFGGPRQDAIHGPIGHG
jgi:hypothetical protein